MATHTLHPEKEVFYFCTSTCFQWLKLIEITNLYDHIYNWFDKLFVKGCLITGYVIMPNHFHAVIYQSRTSILLNKLFSNGKRFMAYEIVDRLERMGKYDLLKYLAKSVPSNEIRKKKKHQVFMPSFDAKLCDSVEMLEDVLDYMHGNPVEGNWRLANSISEYPHSSAKWYEDNIKIPFRWFKDYREILGL